MPLGSSELRADPSKRMMLFSGRANRALAGRIADRLGVARARQSNIDGYAARRAEQAEADRAEKAEDDRARQAKAGGAGQAEADRGSDVPAEPGRPA